MNRPEPLPRASSGDDLPGAVLSPDAAAVGERLTLTIPEAAAMLGISKGLCYSMAAEGRMPGVLRLGRRLVVSRAALLRALEGDKP